MELQTQLFINFEDEKGQQIFGDRKIVCVRMNNSLN